MRRRWQKAKFILATDGKNFEAENLVDGETIATVCGKLETRYRYSNTIGWNTFPVLTLTEQNKADLTRAKDTPLAPMPSVCAPCKNAHTKSAANNIS